MEELVWFERQTPDGAKFRCPKLESWLQQKAKQLNTLTAQLLTQEVAQ